MTDIEPQSQCSPLTPQGDDLDYSSGSSRSSPLAVPGSFHEPAIRGDMRKREPSLLANHVDSESSTAQDSADSTPRGLGHVSEYFVVPAVHGLRAYPQPQGHLFSAR